MPSFDIVGGDGAFFDRFVKAVSFGKSLDGAVGAAKPAVAGKEYLEGDRSLPDDLKDVLANPNDRLWRPEEPRIRPSGQARQGSEAGPGPDRQGQRTRLR